ncbi:hypothetical protein EV384_6816 [Micromonospora kangleipakensis]|uniref:Uncharacterized protein n=2 Tax=Micromonospora kangleipakensis TaxID=1077942 RepID=A0A4V2GE17_9ACTN|nr:hypothetical protein EV384_6816 [Micromonospora kangleipakensis]
MNALAGAGVDTDDDGALRALLIRTEAAADELAAASAQHSDQVAAALAVLRVREAPRLTWSRVGRGARIPRGYRR